MGNENRWKMEKKRKHVQGKIDSERNAKGELLENGEE